ncbi:MAG: hypothetical protein ACRECY_13485, partial [Phyllobacterium sp.]
DLDLLPLLVFLGDWYRLRMGKEMALDHIPPGRLAAYRFLIDTYAAFPRAGGTQARFALILRMMGRYLSGLPSRNFSIDLASGKIEAA